MVLWGLMGSKLFKKLPILCTCSLTNVYKSNVHSFVSIDYPKMSPTAIILMTIILSGKGFLKIKYMYTGELPILHVLSVLKQNLDKNMHLQILFPSP